jgi:hypothetical protein
MCRLGIVRPTSFEILDILPRVHRDITDPGMRSLHMYVTWEVTVPYTVPYIHASRLSMSCTLHPHVIYLCVYDSLIKFVTTYKHRKAASTQPPSFQARVERNYATRLGG